MSGEVVLRMDGPEALAVHHAISTTVQLMDQVDSIPREAPLYGQRDRLVEVARRLDHERRHRGAVPNPHETSWGPDHPSYDEMGQ